ncbi:MAG: hypothetical protein NC319_09805 [Butyricicoccus sp.]|nr:hypothetical protein [Butyricicoccus sp.]
MRIRPCPKKQTGRKMPGRFLFRARDIRNIAGIGKFQPPDCVPAIPPAPDILHGSYRAEPAISRFNALREVNIANIPLTRPDRISKNSFFVKRISRISAKFLNYFLCKREIYAFRQKKGVARLRGAHAANKIKNSYRGARGRNVILISN